MRHRDDMPPLAVLLVSDGRPGHESLSRGIIAAMGRRRVLDVRRIEVRRPRHLPGRLLAFALRAGLPPAVLLSRVHGLDAAALARPDVIVSAGGDTLAANVALARSTGAPNLFYGSLRAYRPADFALSLTSYAHQATAPNRLMSLKPSPLDPDGLSLPRAATTTPWQPPQSAGMIIGGPAGRTARYDERDWAGLLAIVAATAEAWGTRWTLANSPRTPAAVSDRLAQAARKPASGISEFIDFRSSGPGSLGRLFSASQAILCTADSSSMLSEAVWLRRPVLAVAPAMFSLPGPERAYRAWLNANGWADEAPIADMSPPEVAARLSRIRPLCDNPLDSLADVLFSRLPALATPA
ncbi:MAG: ELM1/GtrOC1 family putative glycosyltransferase [Hyphomicrobiaceae bacterium]|nr:ELM1/GtrOC1 family putative glycosyltransferase [Hyphomicrobiaceae bacterium]